MPSADKRLQGQKKNATDSYDGQVRLSYNAALTVGTALISTAVVTRYVRCQPAYFYHNSAIFAGIKISKCPSE